MAKRKADDDELFEPKLSKTEECELSEQNTVLDGKSKRVRKKSAKLLEMEEYEVFEKKIFKAPSKGTASSNSAKAVTKKNKVKASDVVQMSGLDSLADIATAELKTDLTQQIIVPDIKAQGSLSLSSALSSPVHLKPEQVNTTDKQPKVKPTKLKNVTSLAGTTPLPTVVKHDSPPKLKPPKPKQSFEDQLIGPDTIAVQNRTKIKKVKKPKPVKDKHANGTEPTAIQNQPNKEQDNQSLKSPVCTVESKPEQHDSDFKSDEDQPAIWPSQIKEESNDHVTVKLKKKKPKKIKSESEKPGVKRDGFGDNLDNGEVKYSDTSDNLLTQEGKLEIDLDRKQEPKPAKKKSTKKHEDVSVTIHEQIGSDQQSIKEENDEEGYSSGTQPASVYSNTEVMAMKLKTSSEKKASGSSTKMKEKRFRRRGPTAYTMFSNNYRTKVLAENPGIDFAQISKRLGEIWQCLPAKEKMMWKRKARQRVNKIKKLNNGSTTDTINDMVFTSKVPSVFKRPGTSMPGKTKTVSKPQAKHPIKLSRAKSPDVAISSSSSSSQMAAASSSSSLLGQLLTSHTQEKSSTDSGHVAMHKADDSVPCNPIDVAAHLKLLGDSLQTIGYRLQDHKGPIAVQGSLSVLLDSSLCAMASIMCLTNQLPELHTALNKTHSRNLDNIAYIMPGIG